MPQTQFQNHSVTQLRSGPSTCHISPAHGARLLDWHIDQDAIIHWPQNADWDQIGDVRGGNPILFPFVGRHYVDGIIDRWKDTDGTVYEMLIHGFAKSMPYEVLEETASSLHMRLVSNDQTRRQYPFEFSFEVIYELGEKSLKSTFVTTNTGQRDLPYYAGHHFYLEVNHQRRNDWAINLPCQTWAWHNPDGSIRTAPATSPNATLDDPQIVDRLHTDLEGTKVLLRSPDRTISFDWTDNDPWFDVTTWTQEDTSDFYCVEPWLGLPNAIDHKCGLRILEPGQQERVSCEITVS